MLSVAEVGRLLALAHEPPKFKVAPDTAYSAGLWVSEVAALKVGDIGGTHMLIRVEHGKGCKDRNAMRSPHLLEFPRLWRRNVMLPQDWLFPGASFARWPTSRC